MKIKILLLIIGLISLESFSQGQNKISVFYGVSDNGLFRKEELAGAGGSDGKGAILFELRYQRSLSRSFSIEAGFEYSNNNIHTTPVFYPGINRTPTKYKVEMLSLPIYGKYTFLKYLFVSAGPLIDFELNKTETSSIDNQSGIGLGLGIGGEYRYKHLVFSLNPFFNRHALIPFQKEKHNQYLMEIGLKFGVGYHF